jgi:hypothetical protein
MSEELGHTRKSIARITNLVDNMLVEYHENSETDVNTEFNKMYIPARDKKAKKTSF